MTIRRTLSTCSVDDFEEATSLLNASRRSGLFAPLEYAPTVCRIADRGASVVVRLRGLPGSRA
jgi:hypothetical protein